MNLISIITIIFQNAARATGGDGVNMPFGFTRGDGVWKEDSDPGTTFGGSCAAFDPKYGSSWALPNIADRCKCRSRSSSESEHS